MTKLNLAAKGDDQIAVLNYIQQNAGDVLADKINNGVQIVKDGVTLINKKTLDGFFRYATEEARKLVAKDARCACVLDHVVFGWAIHYFEEDEIEGTLYNLDGTEYKTVKPMATPTVTTKPVITKPKKNEGQLSIFDMTLPDDEPDDTDEDVCDGTDDSDEVQVICEPIAQQTATHTIAHDNVQTSTPTQVTTPQAVAIPEKPTQPITSQSANSQAMFYYKYEIMQRQYPNNILLYRVGDFYEALDKGAELLARTIGLTLTGLSCGEAGRHPMCGIPYHALDVYVDKIKQHFAITIMDSDNELHVVEKTELSVVDAVQQNAQKLAELDEDNAGNFVPVIPKYTPQQIPQDIPDDIQNVAENTIRMQNSDTCETDSTTVDMETGEIRSASIDEENRMFNVLYELFDEALTVG